MYTLQYNWEEEHQIIEGYDNPPRREEHFRISAFNVPEKLKNKIVELLDAELQEQLIKATKEYEQKNRTQKKGGLFPLRSWIKPHPDIESEVNRE